MEPSAAPPDPDKGPTQAPFEGALSEVVKTLKHEPFLFVIGIAILLIGLAVLAAALDANDLRFMTLVIVFLAFTVIVGYFLVEVRGKVVAQGKQIEAIQVALSGLLSNYEHEYLRRLAEGRPIPSELGDAEYHYEDGGKYHYSPDLYNRLVRLDNLGFVRPTERDGHRHLDRIKIEVGDETPPPENRQRFHMAEYVEITPVGRKYLELLDAAKTGRLTS